MGDVTLVIASSPYGGSLHEKLVDYLAVTPGNFVVGWLC